MPNVTMIAGPNGSGKSTLYHQLIKQGADFGMYLNADDIFKNLKQTGAVGARKAQEEVRRRRADLMADQQDYCFETVMSHPSHVEHLLEARAQGYNVRLLYVSLEDPKLNEGRVEERVLSGGHGVPKSRIAKRYYRSINNLASALVAAHEALIFDNSSADKPFELIAEVEKEKLRLKLDWFSMPRWFIPAVVAVNAR